jgi:hypothetical protein
MLVAVAAAAAVALVGAPQAHAAACTTTWTNALGGRWTTASNWDNGVPDSSDVACVQLAGNYQVEVRPYDGDAANGAATAKELHLGGASGTQILLVQGAPADSVDTNASLSLTGGTGSASDVSANGRIQLEATNATTNSIICAASPLTNNGTIQTEGSIGLPRGLAGHIVNQGTMTIDADSAVPNFTCGASKLENNGGSVTVGGSRTLTVDGTYTQASGTTDLTNAHMPVSGFLTMTGGAFTGTPPVVALGALDAPGGSGTFSMQRSGTLGSDVGPDVTVNLEGTADQNAGISTIGGAGTNQGTINLTSLDSNHGALLTATDPLTNTGTIATLPGAGGIRNLDGTIDNQGVLSIGAINSGAEFGAHLALTNTGALSIASGGKLTLDDDVLHQNAGTFTVDGTLDYGSNTLSLDGGTLKGTGTVKAATLTNSAAVVHPGDSPGILGVEGNYVQAAGGTLAIEIQGTTAPTGFSQLSVTGTATLGGTLKVTTTGQQPGTFNVLLANPVTGSFANTNFVGQNYAVSTSSNAVTLTAPPGNAARPSITGVPRVGNTLTCTKGIWVPQGSPLTFAYRWLRDGAPLAATAAKRKVVAADQGHKLTCRVTATNGAGGRSAVSNPASVPREPVQRGIFTRLTLRAGKTGGVKVPVRNPNPLATAGVLTLRDAKGKVVGQAKFAIAAKSTKRVKVHLKSGAFAKLLAKGQLKLRATLVLSKGKVKKTARATLTLRPPKP